MVVEKVINNNIVRSKDEKGREILAVGKGLGFQKKKGSEIDPSGIEKIYTLQNQDVYRHMEDLLASVTLETIQCVNEIVEYGKVSLGKPLDDMVNLMLCDHISFALQRAQQGVVVPNALLSEIKRFYNSEYLVGLYALDLIEKRLGVRLPNDEAGFIAIHFVNAVMSLNDMSQTQEMMSLIQKILTIVKYHYNMELDENSIHYDRFITHLKYFIKRIFTDAEIKEGDPDFYLMIRTQYKQAYTCAMKIEDYIQKQYQKSLTEDEMIFLTVHIDRVSKNSRKAAGNS